MAICYCTVICPPALGARTKQVRNGQPSGCMYYCPATLDWRLVRARVRKECPVALFGVAVRRMGASLALGV
eukprot:8718854-Lingulodinium_polyedra.AAC.1